MATLTDRTYFPPLEECLSGKKIILSWRLVAAALEDLSCDRLTSAAVSAFLRDGYVHQLLREPTKTFAPPTNQTKLDFETKTGAINVVPSPNDPYDLDTIKGDAQWLSKNINTNEVAALRVVLIEYQSRAHSHLTGPLSTQDVANIQEAAGVGDAQASAILASLNATTVADAESTWADFESETSRRQRLLSTYLSERRSFLGAVDALLAFLLHSCSPDAGSELKPLRDAVLQEAFGFDNNATKPDMSRLDALAPTYIRTLDDCFVRIHAPPESLDLQILTAQLEVDWVRTALTEAIHAMSLAFQILDLKASHFATPEIVTQWFAVMDTCEFFAPVAGGHELVAELVMPLHSLISAISLKLLNIDRTLLYLDQDVDLLEDEEPYLASSDALTKIHTTVAAAANAGLATTMPLVFAWSLILHQMHIGYQERAERRDLLQNQRAQAGFELEYEPSGTSGRQRRNSAGSIVSIEASSYDVFLASQQLERNIEPAENMARMATSQGQLYGLLAEMAVCLGSGQSAAFRPVLGARARLVFQDLLKRSAHYVGYQSEPVECLLSILSGGSQYWDISPQIPSNEKASLEIYTRMLNDDILTAQYTSQSQSRFPYEFLPFSSICRILSAALIADKDNAELITTLLIKTPSLTVDWDPRWDRSYELVFEEENTNSFRLTRDIDLFDATSKSNRRISPEEKSTMPRGTYGRFVTDVGRVAKLEFEHSTLALFGKRLEVNLMAGAYDSGLGYLTVDELIEGISLLATVLRAETLKSSKTDADRGLSILTEASRLLPHGKDILSIICDTLDSLVEEELADLDGPKIAALSSCLQFLYAALPVCPGRVWAYMARCALINSDTRSGRLSRITANLDMFAERYDLLLSAVKLFSSLVESAMTSAVQRRSGISVNSRTGEENPWIGASDKIVSRVSLSIAQTSIDVFENSATWRFPSEVDRSVLVRDVVGIMQKLVTYAHGVGPSDASKSLTGSLAPAAGYIVESFLSTSSSSLRFQPLLATLLAAFQIPDSTLYQRRAQIVSERLTTVLGFATTLLRVADYLNQASANIQTQLFKSACVVARLPAIRHSFRMPAIALLSALVESAGKSSGEPPSLLGYLGPQVSRSFIQIAGQLDKPFDRTPEVASTWKFFSTILRNRQQWMANCLLTGKTPREALKGEAKISQLTAGSVLSTALEKLRSIRNTSSQETLAILDFFTSAQNYWPWTIFAMQRDKAFLQELRAYVRDLKAPATVAKADPAEACYQARIAAYIAETFAMQLYHLRQMRQEQDFAAEVVNDLDYFLRDGVAVSDYNSSLHANFAKNFAQRYTGCSIDDFKRTLLVPRDLGSQYFYALDVAESMLGHDAGWAGSRHNGFRREMEAANLNLSLVEAEVSLFHAWEYLLLELSTCLLPKYGTARQMLQVAEQCFEANQRPQPPENIFVVLAHSRANLALTLLQRLADGSLLPKDISQLLSLVSATINGVEYPWSKGQISYFRTLLKILFVVLRGTKHSNNAVPQKPAPESSVAVTQLVLTTLDRVVARSFRNLAALVHEPDAATTPEDLALITAILQACLSVPGIEQCQLQVLNIMSSHDILQVATSLFSWSDRLADKGDPIYGELALLLLLELSALPALAEQLACDGLLGHLTSAKLAGFMRRANVSPLADNPGAARCYAVWAKGVLPLLLNILGALGATIAPEVAYVLNQFPNLLRASVDRLEAPGRSRTVPLGGSGGRDFAVALVAVSEVHSLALLTRVLAALRAANARDIPEVVWDAGAVLENVEFWLASRKVLRERLLPLGPREAEWRAVKAGEGSGCENRLEEKAVGLLEGVRDVLAEEGGYE
ncbi:nucleoporin subcomplex protein binding to Pom34-domain-containing protein [Chaetomium sp. MPI-CAGE-AT-0009]|nr:nucleoporin subcomplex protein binding to Pom34-domain-containing protein [Chaetomium sp. MPI-CAGE-AT-0009]